MVRDAFPFIILGGTIHFKGDLTCIRWSWAYLSIDNKSSGTLYILILTLFLLPQKITRVDNKYNHYSFDSSLYFYFVLTGGHWRWDGYGPPSSSSDFKHGVS